jgi:hypothetical protein
MALFWIPGSEDIIKNIHRVFVTWCIQKLAHGTPYPLLSMAITMATEPEHPTYGLRLTKPSERQP